MSTWATVLRRRISRRRALVLAGAAAAGSGLLLACGRDGGRGGAGLGAESLHVPFDTSRGAMRGGTWRAYMQRDPASFDLQADQGPQLFGGAVGSRLVKMRPGHLDVPALAAEPDVAQSWEYTPDKLTLTFRLNPNAKWSPLSSSFHAGAAASIPGRTIDSDDVLFAWRRFLALPSAWGRDELAYAANQAAPIVSLSAPDKSTLVMKLARPHAPLLISLASTGFYLLPREAEDERVDLARLMFGAGPFYIDRYEPGARLILKRNPHYELRDPDFKRPYVDRVELQIVPNVDLQLAKFQEGNVFLPVPGGVFGPTPRSLEEILMLKRSLPDLQMVAIRGADPVQMWFGMSREGPWKDVRVRLAVSYSWDRDLYVRTIFATDKLEALGIPGQIQWNAAYPAGEVGIGAYKGWYLDPQSREFGENARYFTLGERTKDLTEARALLAAAGFRDGLPYKHILHAVAPNLQQRSMEVIEPMMAEAGFRVAARDRVPAQEIARFAESGGDFPDLVTTIDSGGPDPGSYFRTHLHKGGALFGGWDSIGTGASRDGDPFLNETIDRLLAEFDERRRIALAHDIVRYHAKMNYKPRYPGAAVQLGLAWPALQNIYVWRGYGNSGAFTYEWIDPSQKPLAWG